MKFSDKSFESFPPNYVSVDEDGEPLGMPDGESTLLSVDEDDENKEVLVEFPDPDTEADSKASDVLTDEMDSRCTAAEEKEKDLDEQRNGDPNGDHLLFDRQKPAESNSGEVFAYEGFFPPHSPAADPYDISGGNLRRVAEYSVDQQKPVGSTGKGGLVFDSGCNFSGVRKVRVRHGKISTSWFSSRHVIKDIGLEFNETSDDDNNNSNNSNNNSSTTTETDCESIFNIDGDDSILRIDLWTDHRFVTGVRFHLASGQKSKIYGELPDPSPPPTSFRGLRLVGVHGTRSGRGFLQRLGFTFAQPKVNIPPLVPPGCEGNRSGFWDPDNHNDNDGNESTRTPNHYFSLGPGPESDAGPGVKEKVQTALDWIQANFAALGVVLAGFLIHSFLVYKRIKNN